MRMKKMTALAMSTILAMGLLTGCEAAEAETVENTVEEVTPTETPSETDASQTETASGDSEINGKTLVVYYSAQGHTVNFAEAIAEELDADLFELTPVDVYSNEDLDWTKSDSRVTKEHEDESLRDIPLVTTEVEDWESYDTVYIGYPIWWGIAAWPVDNFVKNNDFTGKTVIPFATSSSSGMGESGEILEGYAGTGSWLEGKRFQSNEDVNNAKEWAASLASN